MTPSESPRRLSQALRGRSLAVIGAGVPLAFIALLAFVGPWLVLRVHGFGYTTQELANALAGPSWTHPLGTDVLGRDVFVRLLHGTRISLLVGILATAIAFLIGVAYGSVAGYAGGRIDDVMMRIVDVLYALPTLLLIVILLALFKRSLLLLLLALGSVSWLTMARIVRGQVLRVKTEGFVEAARASGLSTPGIIARHVLPNAVGPIVAYATLTVPSVIFDEAFLSFLGLGVPPPEPSLGVLVEQGVAVMSIRPLLLVSPAVFLAVTIMMLNVLAGGLRATLSPATTGR
jgi:oligopeptide transport system permease protein